VTIAILKGRALLQTVSLGLLPTNAPLTYRLRATLAPGAYDYAVTATDVAGDSMAQAARVKLIVR